VQYMAQKGTLCFSYHLQAQICNVRTVLVSKIWRIEETSASVII
jgi:hypothetical protein